MVPVDRDEALAAWSVYRAAHCAPRSAEGVAEGVGFPCPPKVRRRGDPVRVAQHLVRCYLRPSCRDEVLAWADGGWVNSLAAVAGGEEAMLAALLRAPVVAPLLEHLAGRGGKHPAFDAALARLPVEGQGIAGRQTETVVREMSALAEEVERRRADARITQALAEEGVRRAQRTAAEASAHEGRARADATRAREQAAVAQRRAEHATEAAAGRVASLAARLREQEAENADLRTRLRESEDQVGWLVADFERRLAAVQAAAERCDRPASADEEAAPLAGRRVLVVGDPNRAVGYRAEALALGAAGVVFLDGRAAPGDRLAAAVGAADVVVLVVAWAKHSTDGTVRKGLRRDAVLVVVPQAGIRAFREGVMAGGGRPRRDGGEAV